MSEPGKLRLGVIVGLARRPEDSIAKVRELGLPTCQLCCPPLEEDAAELVARLQAACEEQHVEITTVWAGLPGPAVWNFTEGPATIGLVPPEWRPQRVEALKAAARFTRALGVRSVTTHVGFIPEYPGDALYAGTVEALREVCGYCGEVGVEFWYETGQETPITLLRTIEDVGTTNQGINLDPANLLMYGKANPIDALDVFGRQVQGMHAKDGEYPTNGRELGRERRLREGRANFPVLLPKLKSLGFRGAVTIEREISGPQQTRDIQHAIDLLAPLC